MGIPSPADLHELGARPGGRDGDIGERGGARSHGGIGAQCLDAPSHLARWRIRDGDVPARLDERAGHAVIAQRERRLLNRVALREVRRYASDICRTIPVSGTFSPTQRKYYDMVLEAHDAAISAITPGAHMLDVIRAAAQVFRTHGLERYEDIAAMGADKVWGVMPSPTHYLARNGDIATYTRFGGGVRDLGHHIGLDATDSRDRSEPLAAGMVVTIEPKIYIPELGIAIMIEDMILVTPTGSENLSAEAPTRAAEIERVMRRR